MSTIPNNNILFTSHHCHSGVLWTPCP